MPIPGAGAPTRAFTSRAPAARRAGYRRPVAILAALLAAGCAAAPPAPPPRPAAAVQQRTPPLPGVVGERQNPHRLMLLADNELDLCQGGTGVEKQNACRRRTVYVERARRLGWCLPPVRPVFPAPGWAPCSSG